MRISYDDEIDALYIRLIEEPQECRTMRLNDAIALNIGPGETLIGIEILDAKQVVGQGQPPLIIFGESLGSHWYLKPVNPSKEIGDTSFGKSR